MAQAERALYKNLVHTALVWDVDRDRATTNPVFWHEGALNYVSPMDSDEDVFRYLTQRGIMSEGYNGAYRLNYTFEELDDALDADYSAGLNFEDVLGLLLVQLSEWGFSRDAMSDAGPRFGNFTAKWEKEVRETCSYLAELGYLTRTSEQWPEHYTWAPKAVPIVKKYLLVDITPF